jgi:hypothetical protein
MLAHAAQDDATMTPGQTEAETAALIRQLHDEHQKKRRLRWD